jgi:hypothetical protein
MLCVPLQIEIIIFCMGLLLILKNFGLKNWLLLIFVSVNHKDKFYKSWME